MIEPRFRGSVVKCRVGLGQVKCSNQERAGVIADTNDDMDGGVGGEGRIVEGNIKLCAGQEPKCHVVAGTCYCRP